MSLAKPSIVIFDMDGTTVRHINPRLLHILEKMDDLSYTLSRFCGWLFMRGAKGPIIPGDETFLKRRKPRLLVHRALHKFRRRPVEQIVEPCPGIYAVLDLLQRRGVPMALVSNGLGKGYGHDVLQKFELEGYYRTTVFREDIKKSKPDPESLLLALSRLRISVEEHDVIWFIGDRHKDMTAALAARRHVSAKIIPVAYGLNAAVAVLEKGLGAEHIIMSYPDMQEHLKKLFGPL